MIQFGLECFAIRVKQRVGPLANNLLVFCQLGRCNPLQSPNLSRVLMLVMPVEYYLK